MQEETDKLPEKLRRRLAARRGKNMLLPGEGGGGLLPNMGYTGMCRCEGYGFQAVYSGIGHRLWI